MLHNDDNVEAAMKIRDSNKDENSGVGGRLSLQPTGGMLNFKRHSWLFPYQSEGQLEN